MMVMAISKRERDIIAKINVRAMLRRSIKVKILKVVLKHLNIDSMRLFKLQIKMGSQVEYSSNPE